MSIIKNFDALALTPQRKIVLTLLEEALTAIAPQTVMSHQFCFDGSLLTVGNKTYDLSQYDRVFVVGFGKGSSGICRIIEDALGEKLTNGWNIDVVDETLKKIHYTKGTHPLPSETNVSFTENVISQLRNLRETDFVLVIIAGGGSALFEMPRIPLPRLAAVNSELLKSGATISEINAVRKRLSKVKGGGLAEILYPAKIVSLLFSDVPGNDTAVIASGPTVRDRATMQDARDVIEKYDLKSVSENDLVETPKDEKYFQSIDSLLMVSNKTALDAMYKKAKSLGYRTVILTDRLTGDAKKMGRMLLSETRSKEILLAAGETTVHVTGKGTGGRNQTLVLAALPYLDEAEVIAALDSDGRDFTTFAGAIGDRQTVEKANSKGLAIKTFLDNDNSTEFFQKTGDGIDTGQLESNVSDIYITMKG